jgi:hypothetical protein
MKLHDELYFEITAEGKRTDLLQFEAYLKSGALDDYFEIDDDYILYDDEFFNVADDQDTSLIFTNDEYAIDIDSFDPESFLYTLCKNTISLNVYGNLFDAEDTEYRFTSPAGDTNYENADEITFFNDELDNERYKESLDSDEDED